MTSGKEKMDQMSENIEKSKKDIEDIKNKLEEHYRFLTQIPKNAGRIEEINKETEDLIKELNDNLSGGILEFLNQSFDYIDENFESLDKKQQEIFEQLKEDRSSVNTNTKLKLTVPLINLIGIEIEREFDLHKFLKSLLQKVKDKFYIP